MNYSLASSHKMIKCHGKIDVPSDVINMIKNHYTDVISQSLSKLPKEQLLLYLIELLQELAKKRLITTLMMLYFNVCKVLKIALRIDNSNSGWAK